MIMTCRHLKVGRFENLENESCFTSDQSETSELVGESMSQPSTSKETPERSHWNEDRPINLNSKKLTDW